MSRTQRLCGKCGTLEMYCECNGFNKEDIPMSNKATTEDTYVLGHAKSTPNTAFPKMIINAVDPRIVAARAAIKQADVMDDGIIIVPDTTKISCLVEALKNVLDVLEDMR